MSDESEAWRNQIDQRRLVSDSQLAKQFGARDVSAAAVCLDAPPVVSALQDMFAILGTFSSITTSRHHV